MATYKTAEVRSVNAALASLAGCRELEFKETVEEALDMLQGLPVVEDAGLPCNLEYCIVIRERMPLISALMLNRADKKLNKIFSEIASGDAKNPTWMLCVDAHLPGIKGLFLINKIHPDDAGSVSDVISREIGQTDEGQVQKPIFVGNDREGYIYVATQLLHYFKPQYLE